METESCSKHPKNLDVWIYYSDTGVAVNKQPRDKLKLNIYSEQDATLKQAYANARDKGVVYDLSWYKTELSVNNPFKLFDNYAEKITKSNMVDNSYSLAISSFIKEKCGDCKDVMIVGDDYVVPGYRNQVPITEGFSAWGAVDWFENRITKSIYTDTGLIQRKYSLTISDLKELENRVYFILPNNVNPELRNAIDKLELTIQNKFNIIVKEKNGN